MAANPLPGDTMPRGSSHELLPEWLVLHECSVAGSPGPLLPARQQLGSSGNQVPAVRKQSHFARFV